MLLDKPRSPTVLSNPGTVVAIKKASSFKEVNIGSSSGKEKHLILLLSGSTENAQLMNGDHILCVDDSSRFR